MTSRGALPAPEILRRTIEADTALALAALAAEDAAVWAAERDAVHGDGKLYYLAVKQTAPWFGASNPPYRYTGLDVDVWAHLGAAHTLLAPVVVRIVHVRQGRPLGGFWGALDKSRDRTLEAHLTHPPIVAWRL